MVVHYQTIKTVRYLVAVRWKLVTLPFFSKKCCGVSFVYVCLLSALPSSLFQFPRTKARKFMKEIYIYRTGTTFRRDKIHKILQRVLCIIRMKSNAGILEAFQLLLEVYSWGIAIERHWINTCYA
jgi:hypothetical protein